MGILGVYSDHAFPYRLGYSKYYVCVSEEMTCIRDALGLPNCGPLPGGCGLGFLNLGVWCGVSCELYWGEELSNVVERRLYLWVVLFVYNHS